MGTHTNILAAAWATLGVAACTFASPTYITATQEATEEGDASAEAGASASPASPSPSPPPPATPASDASTASAACCTSKGTCVAESAVPDAQRGKVKADTCTNGLVCVPGGNPVACEGLLGRGFCLDKCFSAMMPIAILEQKDCATNELCIPCSLGKAVPGCS